jgi:dethiobiotin synthetase
MKAGFFITGTDTGVGKTVIAAALIKAFQAHGLNACGMKPIETGCSRVGNNLYPSDGMFLKKVARMDEAIPHVTPYCFENPVAPSLASEMEGREVSVSTIIKTFDVLARKYHSVVAEGVGGILVPIRKDYYVVDLIREMDLPLIVVSRPSLGTINHTLLTVRYALKEHIRVSGIIINFTRPADGTVAENTNPLVLQQVSPVPILGVFPHLKSLDDEVLERGAMKYLNIAEILKQADNA